MKHKKGAIVISVLVGIFALYFIAFVIYNIKHATSIVVAIGNIFPTFMIFGVLSLILLLSAFGGWGKFLRKLGRGGEADNYEKAVKKNEKAYERVKTKYQKPFLTPEEKRAAKLKKQKENRLMREATRECNLAEFEEKWENRPKFSVKNFLTGLLIFAICGGVSGVLFAINAQQNRKFDNPNVVQATATVEPVRVQGTENEYRLAYVYEDLEGNEHVYKSSSSISGVSFREGKTMTVYYNIHNPEIAFTKSDSTMLTVVAIFFLLGGLIVFIANNLSSSNVILPIVVGAVFMLFGGGVLTGIGQASGLNLFETMMCGPFGFGCSLFFALGSMFVIFGIFGIFREIYYFALSRIRKTKK